MPYHIRAGSVRATAANERQALEMLQKLSGSDREEVTITDLFGGEMDIAKMEERVSTQSAQEGLAA